jgi:flagellum-specific ATP synthase
MNHLADIARHTPLIRWSGEVIGVRSATVEASPLPVRLGDVCTIRPPNGRAGVDAEVIGLSPGKVILMPCGPSLGIGLGDEVVHGTNSSRVAVSDAVIGRVLDAHGKPLDEGHELLAGMPMPLRPQPLNPMSRPAIERQLGTGVRAIDAFLPIGCGQRVGIFAGSGVGKSTLLGMLARSVQSDVNVVALIGERGREVREFLLHHLGPEGLARSVVVAATSDQPAVVRARAALTATAMAEYFRDQGKNVFLMMDSVTRFAMARREIELAAGQPPTARGYTPGVFAEIPALCERAGTAASGGSITAVYTVLVEGDDHNEPIADTLRATLDGHIVLTRELAHEGHYPAIDIMQSVSRLASALLADEDLRAQDNARKSMAVFRRYREMIEMGLYKRGSNPEVDAAQDAVARINEFLKQSTGESAALGDTRRALRELVATKA